MSEFLLAGTKDLDSLWSETARHCNILLCSNNHEGECSVKTGCGIGDEMFRFNVMPIVSVDGFDCDEFDHVLLVTPSKKSLRTDPLIGISVIQRYLVRLQQLGVAVFESQTVGSQRIWQTYR